MKRIGQILILLLVCILLAGCSGQPEVTLYVLPADRIADGASLSDIGRLAQKEGRAAFTLADFAGVDWQKQKFAIRPEASPSVSAITAESGGSALLKATGDDRFVWVVGGKAVYYGGFTVGVGSTTPKLSPTLVDTERYIFEIRVSDTANDSRFNKKLYNAFSSAGLIKSEL